METASKTGRIRLDRSRPWAEIVLDHPGRRNAMTPSMVEDLEQAVVAFEAHPPTALLLWGDGGRSFCSGSDLRRVRAGLDSRAGALALCAHVRDLLSRLEALPILRVVAIEGAAVGGGAELALVGHQVFMAANAVYGFLHAGLGVSPGWGGGARLVARVGPRRAVVILAESGRLGADAAAAAGLVDTVCPPGEAVEVARAWLTERCTLAPEALAAAVSIGQGEPDEAGRFAALWGGPAHRRAVGEPS